METSSDNPLAPPLQGGACQDNQARVVTAQGTASSGSAGTIYMTILVDITCKSLSFNLLFTQVKTSGLTNILIRLNLY